MEKMNDYLINKIFTVPYIDKLMYHSKKNDTFVQYVARYVEGENKTYGEAISEIYNLMDGCYRNEYFYKNTIFNELLVKKHSLYDTAALTELPIADSIADFAMINGKGIVYEIKTDLDNLNRLENQINDYLKVFSYINVVVSKKQFKKVSEMLVDTKVGIYVLYESKKMLCKKKARYDKSHLSYESLFRILRKKEYEKIILKYYKQLPDVNNFYYYRECLKWIENINICTLQKEVMKCLKERTLLKVIHTTEQEIPYELKFYSYFTKKKRWDTEAINNFYNRKMEVE